MFRSHLPHPGRYLALVAAFSLNANAADYYWNNSNTEGSGSAFNSWTLLGNYNSGGPGTIEFSGEDNILYTGEISRSIAYNQDATIGALYFESGLTNFSTSATNNNIVTIDGTERSDAGIYVAGGAAGGGNSNIGFNSRLGLLGEVTFRNQSSNPLDLGNASNGRGGFSGDGNLTINGSGRVILRNASLHGYTNTGTTTVAGTSTLHIADGTTYTTSSVTVENGATLSGGTPFPDSASVATLVGRTTIESGGRLSVGGDGSHTATPGVLSFNNLLELQANSIAVFDVRNNGYDRVVALAGGSVQLAGELRLRIQSGLASPGTYTLFDGLDGSSGNFDLVTIRTGTDGSTSNQLTHDGSGVWSGEYTHQNLFASFDANTGILELTAIPEPNLTAFSLIGASLLILKRRKPGNR